MVRGRPSRGAAYTSGIRHPPHHHTPTLLTNANPLADVRPSRIQEHGNKVKKHRLGHTFKLRNKISYIHRMRLQSATMLYSLIYYMGFEAQLSYRLPSPPC